MSTAQQRATRYSTRRNPPAPLTTPLVARSSATVSLVDEDGSSLGTDDSPLSVEDTTTLSAVRSMNTMIAKLLIEMRRLTLAMSDMNNEDYTQVEVWSDEDNEFADVVE